MAIVVVGGHSRNVGKTSVVAGLIAALPEFNWTALKITQFGHGICSADGKPCDCDTGDDHFRALSDEKDVSGETDTSRFLVAGAKRAIWVRNRQGRLSEAIDDIKRKIAGAENVIMESNSIMGFITPDIYLSVLDAGTQDFKVSANEYLDRADAVILHRAEGDPKWDLVSMDRVAGKPSFVIQPPPYVTPEIVAFVRERLGARVTA
jgi:molybdopterin-guanine dinucleotide biosynthesis protein